ncbi:arylsulfatase [Ulvibacterium marinum]|uniref:arylsulfatase n=1 Tax=Ulvibacterium marinum TaxID=2419782 RepID=UPI002494FF3C|nr:arylsulfatase [Ulvibacterium marinum]
MMKKSILLGLAVLAVNSCGKIKKQTPEVSKVNTPNIIYILADDLGYGDLGSYGQERIRTPRLDQMAQNGIRFTNHYAGNTVCAPSRASLMTGLHQGHAPVRGNNNNILTSNDFTLAKMFQKAGYTTALMGKWGLGEVGSTGEPSVQGFDTYFGYLNQIHAHNYYPDHLIKDGKKIRLNNKVILAKEGYAKGIGGAATDKNEYSHSLIIKEALRFLDAPKQKPFFLYLPLTIPHANNEGELTADHGMEVPNLGIYKNRDWPEPEKAKAAMISLLDADVGRILDKLKDLKIDRNTLVIFTSDNGPHKEGGVNPDFFDSNGALKGTKRDLYEGGIRVPFIARWPGKISPNSVSDLPTAFWDMLPTYADVIDYPLDTATDGISFLPTLMGQSDTQKQHDYLYWEFAESNHDAQAIRSGKWKLLHIYKSDSWELYDLSNDIGEENNLIEEHLDVFEKLKTYMKEAHIYDSDYPLEGEPVSPTNL